MEDSGDIPKVGSIEEVISCIEEKAELWKGRTYKLHNDSELMHPYSVLKALANEIRSERGLPVSEEWVEIGPGQWGWKKRTLTIWDRLSERETS